MSSLDAFTRYLNAKLTPQDYREQLSQAFLGTQVSGNDEFNRRETGSFREADDIQATCFTLVDKWIKQGLTDELRDKINFNLKEYPVRLQLKLSPEGATVGPTTKGYPGIVFYYLASIIEKGWRVLRCDECGTYYGRKDKRRSKYCSTKCSSRAATRSSRARDPQKYRAKQRDLMREVRKKKKSNTP